ncbi:hypothetical protein ACQ4M3_19050 [Leptolyngbya sp. AN03gr2]|uniref:hypothetical protein n=1 Tax=Leptolyngbya sp. AN03gr2 TaxID=3423364 RepID=UPI003D32195F
MAGVGRQFDFDRFPEAQRGGLRVYPYGGINSGCAITTAVVGADQKSVAYEVSAGSVTLDGKPYSVAAPGSAVAVPFVPKDDNLFSYKGKIYRGYKNSHNNRGGVPPATVPKNVSPVTLPTAVIKARRLVPAITEAEFETAVAATAGLKGLYLERVGTAAQGIAQTGAYQNCAKFVVVSALIKGDIEGYMGAVPGHQEVIRFVRCTDSAPVKGTWETYNPIYEEPPSTDYLNLPFNSIIGAEVSALDEAQIWHGVSSTVMHVRHGAARMREPSGLLLGQTLTYFISDTNSVDYGKLCSPTGTVLAAGANVLPLVRSFTHAYNMG